MSSQSSLGYHNIVAAVAMHVAGHPAVARAANIAQKLDGRVTLIHTLGTSMTADQVESAKATEGTSEAEAVRELEQLQSIYPVVERTRLVTGRRWSAIVDVAEEIAADLIVVGSFVHGQLVSLLGETSDRVLHHTHRDVLVVHSEAYSEERLPRDYRQIVLALDPNDRNQAEIGKAVWLAEKYNAQLTLLNVIEHFPTDRETTDPISPENQDPLEYQTNLRMRDLDAVAAAIDIPDVAKKVISTTETAKHAVPAFAEKCGADLLVIGSHGQHGLDVLFGKTADNIIHYSRCDVLVVQE